MSISELSTSQKEELAVSLAVLVCHDTETEISADNLQSVLSASNNNVSAFLPRVFADSIAKGLTVEKFLAGPSAGGAVSSSAAGAADAGESKEEAKKEESEEEADLGGGMDMFGGGDDY